MSLKHLKAGKMTDFANNEFNSSKINDNALYQIKQSAYFHHEQKKMDPHEHRLLMLDERIQQHEEQLEKRFEHLEERVKQVNQKFERIEQLGERLESLNKLIDTLKTNFDAKLMVYDDKLTYAQQRFEKKLSQVRNEIGDKMNQQQDGSKGKIKDRSTQQDDLTNDMQQLYEILKKTQSAQHILQMEVSTLKTQINSNQMTKERDIRQSEVIYSKDTRKKELECVVLNSGPMKKSNVMSQGATQYNNSNSNLIQSPTNNHQRVESYKQYIPTLHQGNLSVKNDRVRSITLEKEKLLLQQDLERANQHLEKANQRKKDKVGNQYLNTEEEENEKKSRSKSRLGCEPVKESKECAVDKYQFTLQSKVLQVIDPNGQRGTLKSITAYLVSQSDNNYLNSSNGQTLYSQSKSQQSQLKTFNFKDEFSQPRDRISSNGTSQLGNHSNKESKTQIHNINTMMDGKIKNQGEKQSMLERATSQDNFRSKYLQNDKVGRQHKDEDHDQLKNLRK